MILNTHSAFYYGHQVTEDNQIIPLDEGFGEIAVIVDAGSYTLTDYVSKIALALNDFGSLEYEVQVNRSTRFITISANGNFSLVFDSSTNKEISQKDLLGFGDTDLAGQSSYTAQNETGFAYYPQFKLQNFIDFSLNRKSNSPTVRTSASGQVEVVKYSNNNFMSCNITLITDIIGQGVIKNNSSGVQDAINFMNYATEKLNLEFVYDIENPNNFAPCLLESTSESREGTDFTLQPLYSQGLTGYYELRDLNFRRL